ncbi:MAG TPA: D-aminoacylase [Terriglobales bacterium]|nr:D-aminoacylase [Terriglobales bacterium]
MRTRTSLSLFLVVAACMHVWASDVLIRNVVVYDGTGKKPFKADVRVRGDRIVTIGRRLGALPGETVRDEHGLALAPGFIDMHTHDDEGIFEDLNAEAASRQGVTTAFVGQDGVSNFPLNDFFTRLEKTPAAINFASMVGHATLRKQVMGTNLYRPATTQEIKRMQELLDRELQAGGFGLSSGLEYEDAHFATTEEIIELAKVAAEHGGFYISHVRDEASKVFDSYEEITQIGREAKLPVEISHIKLASTRVWHMAPDRMPEVFAKAQREGVNLKADVYPYTYWASTLRVIVTDRDFFNGPKVERAIADNGGAANLIISMYAPEPVMAGKTLEQIAAIWGVTPVQAYMRMIKATASEVSTGKEQEGVIGNSMSEDDVRWFVADPRIMFCSDGGLHGDHPRAAGAFPRVLGRYVREQHVLSLENAIHKMTLMPAQQLGIKDRGRIARGYIADLVVFDPAAVVDESTIQQPEAPPKGIPDVMVSGEWVVIDGSVTGAHPGRVIRHIEHKD